MAVDAVVSRIRADCLLVMYYLAVVVVFCTLQINTTPIMVVAAVCINHAPAGVLTMHRPHWPHPIPKPNPNANTNHNTNPTHPTNPSKPY